MNNDIQKHIANCTLCCREKAEVQSYPLQMTEIPDRPSDKIAIDLVTECKTSTSGNRQSLQSLFISQDGQKLSLYQISLQMP